MKVIHLLQSGEFSGAENVVCQIFSMLKNKKNIEMIYVSKKGGVESILKENDIPFYWLEEYNIFSIKKAIKEIQPDIIHAHDVSASIFASIASIGHQCKIISHIHVNNNNMSRLNIKTLLYRLTSNRYKHIFWVSNSCYNNFYFKKSVIKKSSILYNVIVKEDVIRKKNKDKKIYKYDVTYVGRLSYQKNPQRLIRLIYNLKKELPNIKVAIVGGNGELFEEIKDMICRLKLENTIDMLGFMNNPLKLIEDSKLMVMTSRYEGLPICVLEAMALGVPVVSTPVDGLKDIILNEVTGFLSNNDCKLEKYICNIIKDSKLRDKLSLNTIERFNKLNLIDNYKNKILDVYLK